jgi:hypothetical protein
MQCSISCNVLFEMLAATRCTSSIATSNSTLVLDHQERDQALAEAEFGLRICPRRSEGRIPITRARRMIFVLRTSSSRTRACGSVGSMDVEQRAGIACAKGGWSPDAWPSPLRNSSAVRAKRVRIEEYCILETASVLYAYNTYNTVFVALLV